MKIAFNLSRNQLLVWISYLETRWVEPGTSASAWTRMVLLALTDLLHKLKVQEVIDRPKYKFTINAVSGLAFVAFSQHSDNFMIKPEDAAVLNEIIGIIDQKTK
ncbi:hypothetical protein [Sphingobacterium hotanense]|uniref:Transcriptional regulator n=1 Tax=Sphingobacterium hotanense TaxID=649196 RepID=A0ABT7NLF5_9SPHI|nr:hypothetical protein [Sphingobacterium hotanense]MDM1048033.1 hypothetical protein [Sphingobacterium hotanense]